MGDKLTKEELELISKVLYTKSKWTGEEFQGVIIPLINKLGKMINELGDTKTRN